MIVVPKIAFLGLRVAVAVGLLVLALSWRAPLLATIRSPAFAALTISATILIAFELWVLLRNRRLRWQGFVSAASLVVAGTALALTLFYEARFHWIRHRVLQADTAKIEQLGRHLLVGYRDRDMLQQLIKHRAIAGVFVTAHNVRGKDVDAVRAEIASLQTIRKDQALPPLLVSTDQEGGAVSRMSPPLPRPPSLGDIARQHSGETERRKAAQTFGAETGKALADLGFNLNFAPVVDINHNIVNANDRYTRIHQRAISDDPNVVTAVAGDYCTGLLQTGVHCTLKHFPGLGRVIDDTHVEDADLTAPLTTLEGSDWIPFRELMNRTGAFTMLGHARLVALDKEIPASFSQAVVKDLLRRDWKHDGVLVTDDFSMAAVYSSRAGIGEAAVSALNAGVDLILISYDPDQFYPVMHALLRADAEGRLQHDQLIRSQQRLSRSPTAANLAATSRQ